MNPFSSNSPTLEELKKSPIPFKYSTLLPSFNPNIMAICIIVKKATTNNRSEILFLSSISVCDPVFWGRIVYLQAFNSSNPDLIFAIILIKINQRLISQIDLKSLILPRVHAANTVTARTTNNSQEEYIQPKKKKKTRIIT